MCAMSARTVGSLIRQVKSVIKGMDEREALSKLIEAGVSISLATKLAADRYSATRLRDETRGKLERFLSLVA